jgi:hypothetical protein
MIRFRQDILTTILTSEITTSMIDTHDASYIPESIVFLAGDPPGIRTQNLRIKSPLLCH